jgi:heptosyltransferase-2
MTIPALRQLRQLFPHAHITLATRAWAQGLLADVEFIDKIMVHEGTGLRSVVKQVKQWRQGNFDHAVLLPNSLETALVASLARVPIRVGYAKDGRQSLLTHPLELPEWRSSKHEVFYYLKIVAELEWLVKGEQSFLNTEPNTALQLNESRKAAAADFLAARGVRRGSKLVALCPGSINSRAKRWPVERYAVLADRLMDELGAEVLLIGSAAEAEVSAAVRSRMMNQPVMLAGETKLDELVAILSLVDLLITNDTGPAHIAAALGRPTLVVFGPTNPLTTRPFSPFAEIVRNPPDCAPCMLRDCPIDHRCMTAITADEVFDRARHLLSDKLQFVDRGAQQPSSQAGDKLRFVEQVK